MFGWGLKCRKCHHPLSIYFARHYAREFHMFGPPVLPNRGDTVIKAKCPKHGAFTAKFNNQVKELWMDQFGKSMLQCTQCEKTGTPENIEAIKGWTTFQIKCPVHGLSETKKIVTLYFLIAKELYEKGISYQEWVELHPDKYSVCKECGHVIEPGKSACDKCGADLVPADLDW